MPIRNPNVSRPQFTINITFFINEHTKPVSRGDIEVAAREIRRNITEIHYGKVVASAEHLCIYDSVNISYTDKHWIVDASYNCPNELDPVHLEDSCITEWSKKFAMEEVVASVDYNNREDPEIV